MRVRHALGVILGLSAALLSAGAIPLAGAAQVVHPSRPAGWRLIKYFGDCTSAGAQSVTATAASDAWATGEAFRFQCDAPGLLLAHWDGRSWQDLPPPPGFRFADRNYVSIGHAVAALSGSYAWIFADRANFVTRVNESFALLRASGRWRTFRFADSTTLTSALAFSRTDAWAFGSLHPNVAVTPYAVRFDGRRWRHSPIPVLPQGTASAGPDSIWAVGPLGKQLFPPITARYALARWSGRWRVSPFPADLVPAGDSVIAAWVVPDNAGGAWVDADLGIFNDSVTPTDLGGALLHWTGTAWKVIKAPAAIVSLGPLAHDGHGGLWVAGYTAQCGGCDNLTILHFRAGAWSQTRLHIPGATLTAMRRIPGTWRIWASATGVHAPGNQGDRVGAMLKYGP